MSSKSKLLGRFLVGLVLAFGLLCYGGLAQAATINVPVDYPTIQSAIDVANPGDTVLVDDGIYTETINFSGLAITVQSVNGAASTIIDGNAGGSVVTFALGEPVSAVLDGFTITNGSGTLVEDNGSSYLAGGGVFCNNDATPTITNCTISGNSADYGAGIYFPSAIGETISNCTIKNNTATKGGGIYIDGGSSLTISDCTINSNIGSSYGGGFYVSRSTSLIMNNCTVSGNSAAIGGGIYKYPHSSTSMTSCVISNNTANYSGGGIYGGWRGWLTITNCTISNNSAATGGGIKSVINELTITNSTIIDNSATGGGGGIWYEASSSGSRVKVSNSTISGNSASVGEGIYRFGHIAGFGVDKIVNSILWGNGGNEVYFNPAYLPINITYSDIQGGYSGTGNIDADPLFDGNYHLTEGSPCIDTGTDDTVTYPNLPSDDIDGDSRPQDGDGNGTAEYDMGSDEYVAEPVEEEGIISGFVTKANYAPIVKARVNLIQAGTLLDFTFTGPHGYYEFVGLADGKYRVVARKRGYDRDRKRARVKQARPWGKEEFINFILNRSQKPRENDKLPIVNSNYPKASLTLDSNSSTR